MSTARVPPRADAQGVESGPVGIRSVDRAITILEYLARRGDGGVTEAAAELDVHRSTAFRLLAVLVDHGLVEQAGNRGRYRLGLGLVGLGGAVADRHDDIAGQSRSVCERLAAEIGETVNLAVLQVHYAVNIDQVRGPTAVTAHNRIGRLTPLHCTASGKVLLAHLPGRDRARAVADGGLRSFTPNTLASHAALEADLQLVRARGHAIALEEYEIGLNAVSAPVRARHGQVIAAVVVSGPAYRLDEKRVHEIAPLLVAAAGDITRRLGYLG